MKDNVYTKPKALQPGMTVAVVAPASGLMSDEKIDAGLAKLAALGYGVKPGKYLHERLGFLASSDANRLEDLHAAFADPKVDAILCMRGGYSTMRLLEGLDFDLIRKNPKIFCGFSDITALNLAFLKHANLVNFNGMMLCSTLGAATPSQYTMDSFFRMMSTTAGDGVGSLWAGHPEAERFAVTVRGGRASGQLVGGNLSLVASLIGTAYEIETAGRVVFLEDVDEAPYKFDRMLMQLLLAGKLRDAAAIVIGRNVADADSAVTEAEMGRDGIRDAATRPFPATSERTWYPILDQVIADRLGDLGIPVMSWAPFGHIDDYATLPLGVRVSVDADSGEFSVDEPAVV